MMSDVARNIRRGDIPFPMGKRLVLFCVHMDFGVGKICQPTDVAEVHVGEDDVL